MTLNQITRVVYGLLGIFYVLVGIGSMLLPTVWFPHDLARNFLAGETLNPFSAHLLQEFGTLMIALGMVFFWFARRDEYNRSFHWAMTFYLSLDAFIHWVGPEDPIGS